MELEYNYNLPSVEEVRSGKCTFLLGIDRHIGEGTLEQETRVGITPSQAARLRRWLENAGISLDFYMVRGAGTSAGFDDEQYRQLAGAIIVDEIGIPKVRPPHVVHALKEPCPYERWIPGPFVRIGALHTGSFSPNSGLAHLLGSPNFSAIFMVRL